MGVKNKKKEAYVVCNRCGREIPVREGIPREDFLSVDKTWGYFSSKDGVRVRFVLCEDCVAAVTAEFRIPPAQVRETELFPPALPEDEEETCLQIGI